MSGDDAAIAEVKESVPGVRGVAVKRAINVRAVYRLIRVLYRFINPD